MGAFILALLIALFFPDMMFGFVRKGGAYSRTMGPTVLEPTLKEALFINIITKNSFITTLYFLASLFFSRARNYVFFPSKISRVGN